jgi:hypothetical protein
VLPLAALLCAAGIGAFVLLRRTHTEPVQLPAIALAEVVGAQAPLFARPDAGEHAVATVHKGDTLNVLRAPRSREQQWTEVQWVSSGRATPAVFARTSDLGNWSSSNEDLARELQQIFGHPRLQAPAVVAPAKEAPVARAQEEKPAVPVHVPPAPFRPLPPATAARSKRTAPQPEIPAPPTIALEARASVAPDLVDVAGEIKKAESFWMAGDYDKAIAALHTALKAQPDSPAAANLLKKVQRAKEAEGL